jgi:hypothetical protein
MEKTRRLTWKFFLAEKSFQRALASAQESGNNFLTVNALLILIV